MIPRIIHCVWFGHNEKSERAKLCLESWKKYAPNFEIKEWNENNFNVNITSWTKCAYENKKWAFVSDYVRLYALYNYGGVYMDTDVELYKPIDEFLNNEGFTGFEAVNYCATATLGAVKENPLIRRMMKIYENMDFVLYDDWKKYIANERTSVCIESNVLGYAGIDRTQNKEQHIEHFVVYPSSYFHTKNEGYAYHSWEGSW